MRTHRTGEDHESLQSALTLCPAYRRLLLCRKADGETCCIASVLLLVLSGTGIGIRAGKCGVLLYIHWGILLSERQGGADCRTDGTGVFEETPDSSVKNVIFNVFKNEDLQIYERILRS